MFHKTRRKMINILIINSVILTWLNGDTSW